MTAATSDNHFWDSKDFWNGLGTSVAGLLGLTHNPADKALDSLNEIPKELLPYFSGYMNAGKSALGGLLPQLQSISQDPGAFYNRLGSGYQQSPGYQFQVNQAQKSLNNLAANTGYLGTPEEQQAMAQTVNGLANQDYNQYIGHLLGLYNTGLNGLTNVANLGYHAASDYGTDLADNELSKAMLAFKGQQNQNSDMGSLVGGIASFVPKLLGL